MHRPSAPVQAPESLKAHFRFAWCRSSLAGPLAYMPHGIAFWRGPNIVYLYRAIWETACDRWLPGLRIDSCFGPPGFQDFRTCSWKAGLGLEGWVVALQPVAGYERCHARRLRQVCRQEIL